MADRPLGEEEPRCDVGIAQPFGHQAEHLDLLRGEAGKALASPAAGLVDAARAKLAQMADDDRCRLRRPQLLKRLEDLCSASSSSDPASASAAS